jgi:hypothetical protein
MGLSVAILPLIKAIHGVPTEVTVPEPIEFEAPADLTLVGDAELRELETAAIAAFNSVFERETHTPEDITLSQRITGDLDRIRAELRVRDVRRSEAATLEQQAREREMQQLRQRVAPGGDGGSDTAPAPAAVAAGGGHVDLGAITEAVARGMILAQNDKAAGRGVASLSAVRERQPDQKVPDGTMAVTASVDIPGVSAGQSLPTMESLGEAFQAKAKAIPVTQYGSQGAPRHLVASVRNHFDHTIDERTNPAQVEELWRSMIDAPGKQDALVAGGGWCAPSQIQYDFFNISAPPSGMIDLPTVGVSRGGIRYPVSPAIGDVFFQNAGSNPASGMGGFAFAFSNATDPWLWTETDDQLTVTGSVNKPTLRVPCPTFNETRLECYGISLTAGNLTDDAYPESTQNFIRLLRNAYAHAINARLISLMDTAAGGATTIGAITTDPAAPRIFNAVELAAVDYRERYAMSSDAVLEVVMPRWVRSVIRSDLAYKTGIDSPEMYAVADAVIDSFFSARGVRVQWVNDYQTRSANFGQSSAATTWPTSANFLIYAAGTFLHGTGLQLDLGVIRDSVLNAENDFTALWAEECHLIAMVGHAARKYTVAFQVNGASGGGTTARV